jgi:hypothetical protein
MLHSAYVEQTATTLANMMTAEKGNCLAAIVLIGPCSAQDNEI